MGRETTTRDDQNPSTKLEQSSRKQLGSGGGGGDRVKRDEWSEGAVTILLEAYESKWILRNRAKLKGQDWEDVAKCVSSRESNSKSPKTQTQCKNKVESMKKRYRSESAIADTSSWPLFPRLDQLLRRTGVKSPPSHPPLLPRASPVLELAPVTQSILPSHTSPFPEPFPVAHVPPLPQLPPVGVACHYSQDCDAVDPMVQNNHETEAKSANQVSHKDNHDNHNLETDSSTPALYSNDKDGQRNKKKVTMKRKRQRQDGNSGWEKLAESIRWVTDAVMRSEQERMETMREVERIRVEGEAKRGEMELKRTEIIANTQLDIARIFASVAGKNGDPPLKIGRSDQ